MAKRYYSRSPYKNSDWSKRQNIPAVEKPFENPIPLTEPIPDGYVYILENQYMPNLYKIGYTARDTKKRAQQLSTTGVPGKWKVAFDWKVADAYQTEQYIFSKIDKYRIGKDEIFDFKGLDVEAVIKIIEGILTKKKKVYKKYIDRINEEKIEYQKKLKIDEIREKEVTLAVDRVLLNASVDNNYIQKIRQVIDDKSKRKAFALIDSAKERLNRARYLKYGCLILAAFLALLFKIESWLFYVLFGFAALLFHLEINSDKRSIDSIINTHSKDYIDNLPTSLDRLSPIMARLGINQIIYVEGIETTVSVNIYSPTNPSGHNLKLEALYGGEKYSKYYKDSVRDALIKFLIHIKSQ